MTKSKNLMAFNTEKIDIISLNIETSSEIQHKVSIILNDLLSTLKKANSNEVTFSIALNTFDKIYKVAPFRKLGELNLDYPLYNHKCTALYSSMISGAKNLLDYIEEVKKKTGITPNASFFTLTSGKYYKGCHEDYEEKIEAKKSIEKLKLAGINTVHFDLNYFVI